MTTRALLVAILLVPLSTPFSGQPDVPPIWARLIPGPHAVGFAVALERDPAQKVDGRDRIIQVACWYPARSDSDSTPLTYGDYFALSAAETGAVTAAARARAVDEYKGFFRQNGVDPSLVDRWLAAPVFAREGAPPETSGARLLLVAQGNGHSIHHQAVVSEYLASHGYVVCTTPSQARISGPMQGDADVLPAAIAQAADLAIAARYARATYGLSGRAGVIGHSFGARSALLLAAKSHAAALVSLDGGIGAAQAKGWLDGSHAVDASTFSTPILHIHETTDLSPDFDLLRSLRYAPRTLVRVDRIRHIDFSSLGFASALVPGLTGPPVADLASKCSEIVAFARSFLDTHLRARQPSKSAPPAFPWWSVEAWPPR